MRGAFITYESPSNEMVSIRGGDRLLGSING